MSADLTLTVPSSASDATTSVIGNTGQKPVAAWRLLSGKQPFEAGTLEWNYTYNLVPIHRAALEGVTLHEGRPDAEMLRLRLMVMVEAFSEHPDVFRKMNPANGWGDFDQHWWECWAVLAWLNAQAPEKVEASWCL